MSVSVITTISSANSDTLSLPPGKTAEKIIRTFVCDGASNQLVITKKETEARVYSVFIKYQGIINDRSEWMVTLSRGRRVFPDIRYCGSRAFSFKAVGAFVKIKEHDENAVGTAYVDLSSRDGESLPIMPSQAIQDLLRHARSMVCDSSYKDIRFNDSIVVMQVGVYGEDSKPEIYVGSDNSSVLQKCSYVSSSGAACGMIGLKVAYEGNEYLLEIPPGFGSGNVTLKDIKWAGKHLYNGN
jgi:hypothetical protein